jgi:ribosomal protein S18 acetylase RimI-like enzyme
MNVRMESDGHEESRLPIVRELFREYAVSLQVDLAFQDFEREVATLPGRYAPPRGCILLAYVDDAPAGCIAMRPLDEERCEMKRLWVRAGYRGLGLGEQLSRALIERARALRYTAMRLDTLASMGAAQRLYRALGFREIPAYYPNPLPGTVYMERALADDP